MSTPIDDELSHWDELDAQRQWPTLLLGNGLSMNLWEGFGYRSLKEKARLSEPAEAIFTQLGTANFEQCLECLHHASITLLALSDSTDRVDETYAEVRDALFDTVREVHIPWGAIPGDTSELIAQVMDYHSAVFTTSYDLCLYWSHMQNFDSVDIVDFFWTSGANSIQRTQSSALSIHHFPACTTCMAGFISGKTMRPDSTASGPLQLGDCWMSLPSTVPTVRVVLSSLAKEQPMPNCEPLSNPTICPSV